MHTDPELLGLLALGENAGSDGERIHADTCPECSRELSELHRLAQLGRSVSPETTMATPSQDVWARIRAELHLDPALEPPTHRSLFVGSDALEPPEPDHPEAAQPAVDHAAADQPAVEPTVHNPRRSLLAMIRSALAGGEATDAVVRADLSPVEEFWAHASGTAVLRTDDQGRRVLTVELAAELPAQSVRQAWLVSRDADRRQTVGILDGPHGLWTVDHAIDLADFPILEISQHALGEGPGETILRGQLAEASSR